jgi:hypothetical protein
VPVELLPVEALEVVIVLDEVLDTELAAATAVASVPELTVASELELDVVVALASEPVVPVALGSELLGAGAGLLEPAAALIAVGSVSGAVEGSFVRIIEARNCCSRRNTDI